MIQEIITYLILAVTVAVVFLNIRKFFKATGKSAEPGKCAGCSGACEIKEFQKFYQPKVLKPEHYKLKL